MSGFIYRNQSTENIIGRRLILCSFDGAVSSITGVQRQNQIGEVTITRHIPNEYGVINSNLQFQYSLTLDPCYKDSAPFITDEEQIVIERWLTSPKYSSDLYIINDNDEIVCTYCGKFTETTWIPDNEGFSGVTFTFENNSAYAKEHREFTFSSDTNNWSFVLDCDSDELEEYVYPVITFINPNSTTEIKITNHTDIGEINNNTLKVEKDIPLIMDCRHCILTNGVTNGTFSFDDVGWADVGNIYWPRLIPGENEIWIDKPCTIKVSYDVVRKKVGGWLND